MRADETSAHQFGIGIAIGYESVTCIPHHLATATGDMQRAAAFAPIGLLDVLSSTTPPSSGREHHIARHLTGLATRRGEIYRLEARRLQK